LQLFFYGAIITIAMKKKQKADLKETVVEKPKKGIVISETEDDVVLGGGFKGDPDDFKDEVKKEAERGWFLRAITPILVFLLLGAVVAYATLYYKNQSDAESPKSKEEKIQTPPTVDENSTEEPKTGTTAPVTAPTTTPTTPPAATGFTEYTVVSGDTLSGIANTHDMTSTALAKYNNISVDTILQIGQKLKIPNN
jgi:LysM repeat protein